MTIPSDDRGFTLGDGLFETVLAVDGRLVLWEEHLARLERGCQVLRLPAPDAALCEAACADTVRKMGGRLAVRLSWSAGSGGRGLTRPGRLEPRLTVQVHPSAKVSAPVALHTSTIRRNESSPASKLKSLAYLDNVLARAEAEAAGADDALMLNTRGDLACTAAGNLFWWEGRRLFTPALECGVLDGIMRGRLMVQAAAAGWMVEEVREGPAALTRATGVFFSNSLSGVRGVARVDGRILAPHPDLEALAGLVAAWS